MVTWDYRFAVFKTAGQRNWAAGSILLPMIYHIQFGLAGYQDFLHRNIQQGTQRIQVINGGQAFALLPFVNCLRFFKTKPVLQIPDGQSPGFPQTGDILTSRHQVNHRKHLCHTSPSILFSQNTATIGQVHQEKRTSYI